jgi:hypothetical protein
MPRLQRLQAAVDRRHHAEAPFGAERFEASHSTLQSCDRRKRKQLDEALTPGAGLRDP